MPVQFGFGINFGGYDPIFAPPAFGPMGGPHHHHHCHRPEGFGDGYEGFGRTNNGWNNSQEGCGWGNTQYSNGNFNNSFNGGNFDHTAQNGYNNTARNYGSNDGINQWGGNNDAVNNGWGNRVGQQGWNNQSHVDGDGNAISERGYNNQVIANGDGNQIGVNGNNQNIEVCGDNYVVRDQDGKIVATDRQGQNRADDAQKGQDNSIHTERDPMNGRTYVGSQREIDAAEKREGVYQGQPSKGAAGGGVFGGETNAVNVGYNNQNQGYHPGGLFGF